MYQRNLHGSGNIAECRQSVRGAKLLRERMPIPEPVGGFTLHRLKRLHYIRAKILFHGQRLRCTRYAVNARSKSFLPKKKSLKHGQNVVRILQRFCRNNSRLCRNISSRFFPLCLDNKKGMLQCEFAFPSETNIYITPGRGRQNNIDLL